MKLSGVKAMVGKVMTIGLVAGAFALIASTGAQAQQYGQGGQIGSPYYDGGRWDGYNRSRYAREREAMGGARHGSDTRLGSSMSAGSMRGGMIPTTTAGTIATVRTAAMIATVRSMAIPDLTATSLQMAMADDKLNLCAIPGTWPAGESFSRPLLCFTPCRAAGNNGRGGRNSRGTSGRLLDPCSGRS